MGEAIKITGVEKTKTFQSTQCSDGIDNDGDGYIDWGYAAENDRFCSSPFGKSEADVLHKNIGWKDFPDFNLNPKLTAVFGGLGLLKGCYANICVEDAGTTPLKKGFTHIAAFENFDQSQRDSIPPKSRAYVWVPNGQLGSHPVRQQPFYKYKIPWNNNLELLKSAAKEDLTLLSGQFSDSKKTGIPNFDLLVVDLETWLVYDKWEIAKLRTNPETIPFVPPQFRLDAPAPLTDEEFISQYKHDMAWLYNEINMVPMNTGFKGKEGSYSDVPLQVQDGWLWYEKIDWAGWISEDIFKEKCQAWSDNYVGEYIRDCALSITFNFGEFMQKPTEDFFK